MEDVLAKLGIKGAHLVAGAIGASVALVFGGRVKTWTDRVKAFIVVIAGATITGYLTPLILLWKPQWEIAEHSIGFALGLFGMGIVAGLMEFVDKFRKDPIGTLRNTRGLFGGGK